MDFNTGLLSKQGSAPVLPTTPAPVDPYQNIDQMAPGQEKNRAYVDQIIKEGQNDTLQNTKDKYQQYMGSGPTFQLPDQMGMKVVGDSLKNKLQSQFTGQVNSARDAVQRNAIIDHQKKQGMVLDLANAKLRTEMAREAREEAKRTEEANKRSAVLGGILGLAGGAAGAMFGGPAGAAIGMGAGQMLGSQIK